MTRPAEFEYGSIRVDRGRVIDKCNHGADPVHPDFSYVDVSDGVLSANEAWSVTDAYAQQYGLAITPSPGTYRFAANLTITSPVVLHAGVVLSPDAGVTVTIDGSAVLYDTLARQVIGAGTVVFNGDYLAPGSGGSAVGGDSVPWKDATDYGATGDGVTDDYAAIAAAMTAANATGYGTVLLPAGDYAISAQIDVPEGMGLFVSSGATIIPTAGFDVIRLRPNAWIGGGGMINVSSLGASFDTYAGILLQGDANFGTAAHRTGGNNIRLKGAQYGTGVYLHRNGDGALYFTQWHGVSIQLFDVGLDLYGEDGAVNSHDFTGLTISGCTAQFKLRGDANGNHIDFHSQTTTNTDLTMLVEGSNNRISGMIWDWAANGQGTYSVMLSEESYRNQLFVNGISTLTQLQDLGNRNLVISDGRYMAPVPGLFVPGNRNIPSGIGNQDDILVNADLRWTVTQTAGSDPENGGASQLGSIFELDMEQYARWDSGVSTLPVTIEIDFGAALPKFEWFGASFTNNLYPTSVTLEWYDGTTWRESWAATANDNNAVMGTTPPDGAGGFVSSPAKVRITFSGFAAGESYIRLERLWAFCGSEEGKAFLPQSGAGDAIVSGTPTFLDGIVSAVKTPVVADTYAGTDPLTDWPYGVTMQEVSSSSSGWPQTDGLVVTFRSDTANRNLQAFTRNGKDGDYIAFRTWDNQGLAWNNWYAVEVEGMVTFGADDATPSVAGYPSGQLFKTNNTAGAINLTAFDDGRDGQVIHVTFGNGLTTLKTSTGANGLYLAGAADWTPVAFDCITLGYFSDRWRELGRSDNS